MSELVVLVPVLDRPENVAPLMKSFRASGAPGNLLFVLSDHDEPTRDAVLEAGGSYVWAPPGVDSWPAKVDWAWKTVRDDYGPPEWVLLAADDVTFKPGWWSATKHLRSDPAIRVIGTNDLANPRVLAGNHATHPLIRHDFRSVDGDSPVHPGYSHWYVDDELVATAKSRGEWAFCRKSVVQHHHPYFDKSVSWDSTYQKGEESAVADAELWKSRRALVYANARPFPHIALDGVFQSDVLADVLGEWPDQDDPRWKRFEAGAHETGKLEGSDPALWSPSAQEVLHVMKEDMLPFMEQLTGIEPLWSSTVGGGYHEILPGGALGLHADFNTLHAEDGLKAYRRVNALLFLNPAWQPSWGGELELHGQDGFVQTIDPVFNRLAVFTTGEKSWHGHPHPLRFPKGYSRKSLAVYYFSDSPADPDAPEHSTVFKDIDE